MEGLSWESFRSLAERTICKECECGGRRPWRSNTTCLQSWLRFHSSRGIIVTCSASLPNGRPAARIEDSLMSEMQVDRLAQQP
ncbi:MAG: hypothetical protein V1774_05670 [Candidatus Eisenbacteria bacterium]